MKTLQKEDKEMKEKLPESFVEIFVLTDRILLFLRSGKDITKQLEEEMGYYGLKLKNDFKSPCG